MDLTKLNWELLIAIFSLVLSICSIIYAHFNKKLNLDVVDCWVDYSDPSAYISFGIVNASTVSASITDIKLFKKGKKVSDNGFEPDVSSSMFVSGLNYRFSNPFREKFYIEPFKEEFLSYYINKNELPDKIVITSSQRVGLFIKTKSFYVIFVSENN